MIHTLRKTALYLTIVVSSLMVASLVSHASAAEEPTVVALFGDSISQGFNRNFPQRGFAMGQLNSGQPSIQLTTLLNDSGRPSVVPNLGWGGTSSGPANIRAESSGVSRITQNLIDLKADISGRKYFLLIMYGTNDFNFGIPASVTGFNNGLMIDRANEQDFTAVVSTIPPCDVCNNNVNDYNAAIISAVLQKYNAGADVHFVDNHAVLRADWTTTLGEPDGVHPTDAGYEAIAKNWFETQLEELIEPDVSRFGFIAPVISLLLDD